MAFVRVADVLADLDLAESMDPGLVALLARLHEAAMASHQSQRDAFDSFVVVVSASGDIEVDTSAPNSFADWVWAAGDLALHVGPSRGEVNGETRSVAEILGSGQDGVEPDPQPDQDIDVEDPEDPPDATTTTPAVGVAGIAPSWTADGPPLHWSASSQRTATALAVVDGFAAFVCSGCGAVSDDPGSFGGDPLAPVCGGCGAVAARRVALERGTAILLIRD